MISHAANTFAGSGLPLLLDRSDSDLGILRGHFAREKQWKALDGPPVLALWAVTDAPAEFIDKQLRAMVCVEIEIEITRLDGNES